mgnify:CR=1 FL=1
MVSLKETNFLQSVKLSAHTHTCSVEANLLAIMIYYHIVSLSRSLNSWKTHVHILLALSNAATNIFTSDRPWVFYGDDDKRE